MEPLTPGLLSLLHGSRLYISLVLVLPVLLVAAWQLARRVASTPIVRSPSLEYACLAATSLLVCGLVRLPFALYIERNVAQPAMWIPPLDRLFATVLIVTLGLALTGTVGARRWQAGMVTTIVLATSAWAAWAPAWSAGMARSPGILTDPTGLAHVWDLTLFGLAIGLTIVLTMRQSRPPRWVIALPALLAAGAFMQAVAPVGLQAATWLRAAELTATAIVGGAIILVAYTAYPEHNKLSMAFARAGHFADSFAAFAPAFGRVPWSTAGRRSDGRGGRRSGDRDGRPTVERDDLGGGDRDGQPTVSRDDLGNDNREGRPVGRDDGGGFFAGFAAPARTQRGDRESMDGVDDPLSELAAIGASPAVILLRRQLDALASRIERLEASSGAAAARVDTSAATEEPGVAARERAFAASMAAYGRAMERVPWSVFVCHPDAAVAFANDSARSLVGSPDEPGTTLAELVPDAAEDIAAAFRALREADDPSVAPNVDLSPIAINRDSISLKLEPLWAPGIGLLGAIVVGTSSLRLESDPSEYRMQAGSTPEALATTPEASDPSFLPLLVDALREPMRMILTHHEVLARSPSFAEPELTRHLGVVDAQLNRLDVRLTDLLTVLELEAGRYSVTIEPIDVGELLEEALRRAAKQFEEKGLRAEREVPTTLPRASADRRALLHVLDNLLATAVDGSAYGATITVRAALRSEMNERAGGGDGPRRMLVITVQYRNPWDKEVHDQVFAIDAGDATPALRIVRLLAEVQGGKAWGETRDNDGRLLLNVGLPEYVEDGTVDPVSSGAP